MLQMSVLHLLYQDASMSTKGRLYQARRGELKLKKFVTEFSFVANVVPAVKVALCVHGPPPAGMSLVRLPGCSDYGCTKRKITSDCRFGKLWQAALSVVFQEPGERCTNVHSRDRQ